MVALFPAVSAVAGSVHVVKKGETLTGLARKYGVSVAELARANDLTTKTKIKIGDRLSVPGKERAPQLDGGLKRQFDRVAVKSGRWKNIVIHHSATNNGTVKGMDRYHRENRHMENGLAYHFVIGNGHGMKDGEIVAGGRWNLQLAGGHLASEALNRVSIGICLVGNFESGEPSAVQLRALAGLVSYLLKRCALPRTSIKTHQQINTVFTRCPGKKFPFKGLMALLG